MRWLCLVLVLSACGTPPDPAALRARLTPAQIAQLRVPMIFVTAPRTGLAATLIPVRQEGDLRVWQSRDGAQIITRDGQIIGTRGLGFDMMSGEAPVAMSGTGAAHTRRMTTLSGDLETSLSQFSCRITPTGRAAHPPNGQPVTIWVEDCGAFINTYHRGRHGTLWWSRQWVSPELGALEIEVIRP